MKATVYKSTGSWYQIKDEHGAMLNARIKGKFKLEEFTSTNPLAVGDVVTYELENDEESPAIIDHIFDRKNYITRQSPHNKNQQQIIASNIDQCLILATLRDPKTSSGFIDRLLVATEAYHIPAIIVFNKSDIYKEKDFKKYELMNEIYSGIGYPVYIMSVASNTGVHNVTGLLHNKTTLISGHSGVGKSSFINYLFPEKELRTQDVSEWSGKGLHTTTFAEMHDMASGGRIIDTPGLREFALMDISPQELSHYFPEMRTLINECRFNNCMHIEEPGCAVKNAVELKIISASRYISYLNILNTIEEKKW